MSLTIPTREQLTMLDQRAEVEHEVPQWAMADGTRRGVVLRALTPQDRMEAEVAAYGEIRKGEWQVNAWVQMCQEVARGILRPAGIPADHIAIHWNEAVVRGIYDKLQIISYIAPAEIAAARAASLGGPAPDAPTPPAPRPRRRREPAGDGVGQGDSPTPGDDASAGDEPDA